MPRGLIGWLSAADHKTIGKRFIATAFAFFVLGGILAVLMRIQLAQPENTFVDPDLYNQLFTLHGTTMMFLFAVPIMEAMALYLVPLMIGTREIAFPRLTAFNYWVLLFGGAMIYIALVPEHRVPTPAGSATSRWRDRNTRRASAWTSGRRWSRSPSCRRSGSRSR